VRSAKKSADNQAVETVTVRLKQRLKRLSGELYHSSPQKAIFQAVTRLETLAGSTKQYDWLFLSW
jgi:hypothetical protein